MSLKTIKAIIPAQKVNMGGHLLDQPLPVQGLEMLDPFLLIHHWKDTLPGGQKQNEVGVGPHPHRGFSPVTFVFKGEVEHRDSLGNFAKVSDGGTQWMFAGRGITHSERFSKEMAANGGALEFIQFWVNAPASHKMDAPFYKPISLEETPSIAENGSTIWVVAGNYKEIKGAADTYTPQILLRGQIESEHETSIEIPAHYNTLIYLLDGALEINQQAVIAKDMIVLNNDGNQIAIKAAKDTRYIVLSGIPINEPVASYGPFVMNNETELMQALRDSQMGKMGILIEEFE